MQSMTKYIYFHICTLNAYAQIITDMMNQCMASGLMDEITELRYYVTGIHISHVQDIMRGYPKTRCVQTEIRNQEYERFTLHALRADCQRMEEKGEKAYILYLHSKGVSRPPWQFPGVASWRETMIYGLSVYRHVCWEELGRGVDAVGSYYRDLPRPHFSGNFWWARSSHIATLDRIGPQYLDPEMWILSAPQCTWSELQNEGNSYFQPIEILFYKSKMHLVSTLQHDCIPTIPRGDVDSIEMGSNDAWVRVELPPPGTIRLCRETFRIELPHGAEMVKIRTKHRTRYFLEGQRCTFT